MPKRTIHIVVDKPSADDELRSMLMRQLRAPGGDPSQLLELLELAMKSRPWEGAGFSFQGFITAPYAEGGIGWSIENLVGILRLHHAHEGTSNEVKSRMDVMRQEVERLLIKPAKRPGKPNSDNIRINDKTKFDTNPKNTFGTSRTSTLARLRRDRPDLAEQVLSGTKTANQAAIEAGFRQRSIQFYPDDVDRTIAALCRHMSQTDLVELAQALSKCIKS